MAKKIKVSVCAGVSGEEDRWMVKWRYCDKQFGARVWGTKGEAEAIAGAVEKYLNKESEECPPVIAKSKAMRNYLAFVAECNEDDVSFQVVMRLMKRMEPWKRKKVVRYCFYLFDLEEAPNGVLSPRPPVEE